MRNFTWQQYFNLAEYILLPIFIVLLLVTLMKVANFTDNIWVSELRALGEGHSLFHVNLVDRFVQLAAWAEEDTIYISVSFQCLSSVLRNNYRKGVHVFFHLFTLTHMNWNRKILVAVILTFLISSYVKHARYMRYFRT